MAVPKMNESTALTALSTELAPQVTSPDAIQQRIRDVGGLLTGTEARLAEISARGFWKRAFANNSKDLALAIGDVVQIQQFTVALVLAALDVHAGNLAVIEAMRQELDTLHGGLGRAANTSSSQAEGLLHVRSTIGHMVAVVDRQLATARRARADQERLERLASTAESGTAWARRLALSSLFLALISLLVALYVAYRIEGGFK